ncbi:hypothetical protein TEA_015333 [Camellia sinensis var. sinensis]|uniref:DUF1639 domain-containing protein n=1 Tax=Camellia sinensis var. sinensis TaxID=542762 RepID=A0A4S4DXH0_CAMSN|nr:hypothetical protein TEA_015333 [Camellia sinensis var. sinensis]
MLFRLDSESETLKRRNSMASSPVVPAKSQPLHNFSLPLLKWPKNHTNNLHRGRRLSESSPPPPPPDSAFRHSPPFDTAPPRQSPLRRPSPMRDSASESESGYVSENRRKSAPEIVKNGFVVSSSDHIIEKSEKKSAVSEVDGVRSKIYIRLRTKNKVDDVQEEGKTGTEGGEVEESVAKTWNLRPRKPIAKLPNANGGSSKVPLPENKAQLQPVTSNRPESIWLRSGPEAEVSEKEEKKKKQKFSISLSRQEIEEDIFSMSGSKPARRPKKRAKIIQKQIDNLFPGLWLASITPDCYKVSEAPLKGSARVGMTLLNSYDYLVGHLRN